MYTLTEGAHNNIKIIPIQTIINADAGIMDLGCMAQRIQATCCNLTHTETQLLCYIVTELKHAPKPNHLNMPLPFSCILFLCQL